MAPSPWRFKQMEVALDQKEVSRAECAANTPKTISIYKSVKKLGEISGPAGMVDVVSQRVKDIIEQLEPSVHQFVPITVLTHLGEPWAGQFYILRVMTFLSALFVDRSGVLWLKNKFDDRYGLAIDSPRENYVAKERIEGYHLWLHHTFLDLGICGSDRLRAAFREAKIPYLSWTKHFVVDENGTHSATYSPKIPKTSTYPSLSDWFAIAAECQ